MKRFTGIGSLPAIALAVLGLAALPAQAQIDITGEWAAVFHEDFEERRPGPEMVEYQGVPINEASRRRALSWSPTLLNIPEHQCKPHPSDYGSRGPSNMRIWKEVDSVSQQLIAYHTRLRWQAPERTIWMDGREHPPENAPHTWQGFSTGHWEGDTLSFVRPISRKAGSAATAWPAVIWQSSRNTGTARAIS